MTAALATCKGAQPVDDGWVSSPYEIDVEWDRPVELGCLLPGYALFQGASSGGGAPREAFAELILVRDGKKRVVRELDDLRGHVHIGTKRDALAFVRLRTDLETEYLFKSHSYHEVRETLRDPPDLCEVDAASYARLGLRPPEVTRVAEGYDISRFVVDNDQLLYRTHEAVGTDGRHLLEFEVLAAEPLEIALPGYW